MRDSERLAVFEHIEAAGGKLALEFLSGAGGTLDLQRLAGSERESEVDEEGVLAHEVAERPALIRADQHGIAGVAMVANADTPWARHLAQLEARLADGSHAADMPALCLCASGGPGVGPERAIEPTSAE